MSKYQPPNWQPVTDLATRVLKNGGTLKLTSEVLDLLRRNAPTVGIAEDETAKALRSVTSATALLRKIRTRIHRSSNRLMNALHRMYKLRDAGNLEGARQLLCDVLAMESVALIPHARLIAQGELDRLDNWKPPTTKIPRVATAKQPPRKPAPKKVPPRKATPSKPSKAAGRRRVTPDQP